MNTDCFQPFPELHTQRLLLRKLTLEDAPELFFLRSDEQVLKYLGRKPATSINEVKDFIQLINQNVENKVSILWAIALDSKPGQLIGTICFWNLQPENYRAEIGYILHPSYWKKGIMQEALDAVMKFGFSKMKINSVEARLCAGNEASVSLLERSGFKREGYFRQDVYFNNEFSDSIVYSKLVTDDDVSRSNR
jgi:[ribosomal protein S5]-alanine N-acetyltransferase